MEQFKIKPGGFKEVRKGILIKTISFSVLAMAGGVGISYYKLNLQQSEINVLPFIVPILFVSLAIGAYIGINRQKQLFESYTLIIDNTGITRKQSNTPAITISREEIRKISKNANGSFTVRGNSAIDMIGIPAQIEEYEKLEQLLAEISTVSLKNSTPFFEKYSGLLSILVLGLMAAVYLAKDKIIVGVCGTVLMALMSYSFIETRKSKNIDDKTKKAMWLVLLVIASIIGSMCYKLAK